MIWGCKGQGFGVQQTIGRDVRDESSEGSGKAVMAESTPTDGDYCPPGEPREIREPRLNGNGRLNAKVSRTDIGVEMGDPCFGVGFFGD